MLYFEPDTIIAIGGGSPMGSGAGSGSGEWACSPWGGEVIAGSWS